MLIYHVATKCDQELTIIGVKPKTSALPPTLDQPQPPPLESIPRDLSYLK